MSELESVKLFCAIGREASVANQHHPPPTQNNKKHSGGDFPHLDPAGCRAQLSAYITSGAYMAEVNASVASAFAALGLQPAPGAGDSSGGEVVMPAARRLGAGGRPQVVVFDIDETALSNIVEFERPRQQQEGATGAAAAGRPTPTPPARRGAPADWDARVIAAAAAAASSPALAPTLALYRALCRAGVAVAFVTGRGEATRAATRANLLAAGYGDRCAPGGGGAAASSPSASSNANDSTNGAGGACCYVDLILRPPGDARLASVYKPWARARLEAAGYELLASVGDQFSDLNGEHSARLAWKLPNPFYYIM